jgi:hypothetical protein
MSSAFLPIRRLRFSGRFLLVLIVAALGMTLAPVATNASTPSSPIAKAPAVRKVTARQMWVWRLGDPQQLVSQASRGGVTQLLVWVSPHFTSDQPLMKKLATLRVLAARAHQQLVALCGDPSWATAPSVAGSWAKEVARSKLFSRVHLDIEPYTTPQWQRNPQPLAKGLLDALTAARGSGLPVDADIPYWYNQVSLKDGSSLDIAVMRRVSSVTLMSYTNSADGVLRISTPEMNDAKALKVPAYIGINVAPSGGDPASSSFYGQRAAAISAALSKIQTLGTQWSSFAGTAVHDAEYFHP